MSQKGRTPFNFEKHATQRRREVREQQSSVSIYDGGDPASMQDFQVSGDGRRARTVWEEIAFTPQPQSLGDPAFTFETDNDMTPEELFGLSELEEKKPAKRYALSDKPLLAWIPHRKEFLYEALRDDGRESLPTLCSSCKQESAIVRCRDCFGPWIWCQTCAVEAHQNVPLHRLEQWSGTHFASTSLRALGFRFQLGHEDGLPCFHPIPAHTNFIVIHTNGIHSVAFDFCGCGHSDGTNLYRQLLRVRWWPSSLLKPKTCATFVALKHFHMLNLQGHLSAYDFYRSIELETDNAGLLALPDRLASFMLIVRQWRHIKMLKRSGLGHTDTPINQAGLGSCAVVCGACPIPDVNLPTLWQQMPLSAWLYRLFIALDCNFRLSNSLRSNDEKDPGLGTGLSYFVPSEGYNDHIIRHADEEELSTCAGFEAILRQNLKRTKGLRSTGVVGVICSRHQLWRPNGMGDLQKGERYCNVDWVLMSALREIKITRILISYDIMCQWERNLYKRMANLPPELQLNFSSGDVDCTTIPKFFRLAHENPCPFILFESAIPKFHLPAHQDGCQTPYSLNLKFGAGRVDGEGIERNWSEMNPVANSTREMGPGSRHDTLDDHCGHRNWRKSVNFGNSFLRKMRQAIPAYIEHQAAFIAYDTTLRSVRPEQVDEWSKQLAAWELDSTALNPYQTSRQEFTIPQLRLKYTQAEAEASSRDFNGLSGMEAAYEVGPSEFIFIGLEIENMQASITRQAAAKSAPTSIQAAKVQERRASLLRKLRRFRELQGKHMRNLTPAYRTEKFGDHSRLPEAVPLILPSHLPPADRDQICLPSLTALEAEVRLAQLNDSLANLRQQLRLRSFANRYKVANVTGQRASTKTNALFKQIADKVRATSNQYRRSREAYLALVGPGDWENALRVLLEIDVRAINERALTEQEAAERRFLDQNSRSNDDEDSGSYEVIEGVGLGGNRAGGEGFRSLSWIWFSVGTNVDLSDPTMHEALRVEWCKSKARAKRWREELMLLEEEMRRTIVFNRWTANDWLAQATSSMMASNNAVALDGLQSYAHKEARIFRDIATLFDAKWKNVRSRAAVVVSTTSPLDEDDVVPENTAFEDEALGDTTDQSWEVDVWDLRGMEEE